MGSTGHFFWVFIQLGIGTTDRTQSEQIEESTSRAGWREERTEKDDAVHDHGGVETMEGEGVINDEEDGKRREPRED